jgi:hypothetical protein
MRRGTALDIAQRAFAQARRLTGTLREEVVGTQMPPPPPPMDEPTFGGWTIDEKIAFYARGTIPERFKR